MILPDTRLQYWAKRASVIRKARTPVGSTRNTASGPATAVPRNVGWVQVNRRHTSVRPRRAPRPSPPQVTVARSILIWRPSIVTALPASRRTTFASDHAASASIGRAGACPRGAWPGALVAERLGASEDWPPPHAPRTSAASNGATATTDRREHARIRPAHSPTSESTCNRIGPQRRNCDHERPEESDEWIRRH
jgi:hypothetical protein